MELLSISRSGNDKSLTVKLDIEEVVLINNALYQKKKEDVYYEGSHKTWNEFYEILQFGHTVPRYRNPKSSE